LLLQGTIGPFIDWIAGRSLFDVSVMVASYIRKQAVAYDGVRLGLR
jgi:hypothetical protein